MRTATHSGEGLSSQQFAEELAQFRTATLPRTARDALADLVVDYITCVRAGADLPWVRTVGAWADEFRGAGGSRSSAWGERYPAEVAAMVDAVACHGFELDDTHDRTLSHPGSVAISTALAVATEHPSVGGEQFLDAVAAGYETMGRLGDAVDGARLIASGSHPTAVLGAFASATTAVLLSGGGTTELVSAWGHTLSMTAGSMQFSEEPRGAEIKRLHAGLAARSGVMAARLAVSGLLGPEHPIEGRYGFTALFGDGPQLVGAPGPTRTIEEVSLKPYACCRQFHAALDGLTGILSELPDTAAGIERVVVAGPRILLEQHSERRPGTPMSAQYSLPYTVAAALVLGDPMRIDMFNDPWLHDTRILELAARVEIEQDGGLEQLFPATFPARVSVLAHGKTYEAEVRHSRGTPANPFNNSDASAKAARIAGIEPAEYDTVAAAARTLENSSCAAETLAPMFKPRPAGIIQ